MTLFLTRNKILFICNTRLVIVFQIYRYSKQKNVDVTLVVYLLRTNSTLLFSMIALLRFIDLHIFMFT